MSNTSNMNGSQAKDSRSQVLETLSYLEVPAVHPDGCLRQGQVADEAKV